MKWFLLSFFIFGISHISYAGEGQKNCSFINQDDAHQDITQQDAVDRFIEFAGENIIKDNKRKKRTNNSTGAS